MFIGDLVKLKSNTIRNNKDKEFVRNGIKEDWIWLITGMDNENLDFAIQPLHLEEDYFIQLGGQLLVLDDEIEKVEIGKNELFKILSYQRCNY